MKAVLRFLNGRREIIPIPNKQNENGQIFYPANLVLNDSLFLFTNDTEDGFVVYKEKEPMLIMPEASGLH